MFHLLGFLFIIIVAILVIGLGIIGTVLRNIFGQGGKRRSNSTYQSSSSQNREEPTSSEDDLHKKREKLFSKDEGEYVDFEEIKENNP